MKKFLSSVRELLLQLLRVDAIRWFVATVRYIWFAVLLRRLKTLNPGTGDIGVNAVHHNLLGLKNLRDLAVNRSTLLLYPLSVLRSSKSDPLLSIGPRSEGELLNSKGLGFRSVRGLDLISYSPWIDLGDMHAMPYKDNQFGIVMIGWVLAYSDNRMKAAQELLRVTRNGGLIAVGSEWRRASAQELSHKVGYELCDEKRLESTDDILALFGGSVDRVLLRRDLPVNPPDKFDLVTIFSVKK